MKSPRLPSLSHKLFLTFILSFFVPLILIELFVSYLFSDYQYQGLHAQSENNTQLISAYMTNYINDIDDIMKGLYFNSYLQSETDLSALSIYDKSSLSEEIGDTLSLTAYSRDDFGDLLFMSEREILYFNAENYYQYLPTTQSLEDRSWYLAALEKDGKIEVVPIHGRDVPNGLLTKILKRTGLK